MATRRADVSSPYCKSAEECHVTDWGIKNEMFERKLRFFWREILRSEKRIDGAYLESADSGPELRAKEAFLHVSGESWAGTY